MTALFWIILAFLIIISVIDWKVKAIPSVMLTGMLFVTFITNYENVMYGLFAFVLAYLLYESNYFGGVADIKVMTIIGLMVMTLQGFMIYVVLLMILGLTWKIVYKWKHPKAKLTPFIPVFTFCYIALALLGVVL